MSCSPSSPLEFIRRDTVTLTITFTDQDGTPIDLTGSTVFFTLKEKPTDPDSEALIATSWTVHSDPTAGVTSVTLSTSQTDIDPGSYYYDFQIRDGGGAIQSTKKGTLVVLQDITVRIS